ncbi:hypothetical protein chiPu_0032330, partial [Chiloscyllium punctatum]|nr:hypothetical protein [Chiloscyllium punctatum]
MVMLLTRRLKEVNTSITRTGRPAQYGLDELSAPAGTP